MIRTFELALPHGITLGCRTADAPASTNAADAASAARESGKAVGSVEIAGASESRESGKGVARGDAVQSNAPCAAATLPRVLLLHGFPEAAFVWDDVMRALAGRAHCIAPNLRGYAGSSAPVGPAAYKARLLVADVAATIEAVGAPVDLLVAHDWGGALAWGLAAARPELLKRLLIINAPHPATFLRELRGSPVQQAASAYMNFLCRPDAAALLAESGHARLWRFFGTAPAWLTPALRSAYVATWSGGLDAPLNYYRASPLRPATGPADALHTLDLSDEAVTVRVPTTVWWGLDDAALLPGLLEGLDRWVPGVEVDRVAGASHWIVHEQPSRLVALIERLLAATAATAATAAMAATVAKAATD